MVSKEETIRKAISFAEKKHEGQTRKDKTPYINHPLRVAEIVKKFKKSHRIKELTAAAILHDTLEDTDTNILELKENFGELITLIVIELTTDKTKSDKLGKTNYLSKKLSSSKKVSRWSLVIKLADRLDNVSDLKNCDKKFAERYKKETYEILKNIEEKRELSKTHKKLISEIKKKLKEIK